MKKAKDFCDVSSSFFHGASYDDTKYYGPQNRI